VKKEVNIILILVSILKKIPPYVYCYG